MSSRCAICSKSNATSVCSGCTITFYCDAKCQRKHWKIHKKVCKTLAKNKPKRSPLPKSKSEPAKTNNQTKSRQAMSINTINKKSSQNSSSPRLGNLTKSRKSIELSDDVDLKQLADEQQLFEKLRKIPELSSFTDKLVINEDLIAFYLDNPEEIQHIIDNPTEYIKNKNTFVSSDNPKYLRGLEINRSWFKQHTSLDIIQHMRDEFELKNKVQSITDIINYVTKTVYKLELTPEILNEIESFSLYDYQINIIEINPKCISEDLFQKQISDSHWIETNILNKTSHDSQNGFFTKYFKEKLYKSELDREIKCGDIIHLDLNDSQLKDYALRTLFYVIGSDDHTMHRIGMVGSDGIHCGTYIYGRHIIIPFHVTYRFYDPIKTYLEFMHRNVSNNVQMEIQMSNTCVLFDKKNNHCNLNKMDRNNLLAQYPWPKSNKFMNVKAKKALHKYRYELNEMSGDKDSEYCTIYIDLNRKYSDDGMGVFGNCNNDEIECINLSAVIESASGGYVVKHKEMQPRFKISVTPPTIT